ncbi:hypothetical protein LFT44_15755 [Arthrobacter sp. FW306-05-C]|uniref:hypothetical protein n=1 Tax=Arthrobacter sp. FW306-05-C TaxID=2879620 RepID=UPI001F1C1C98|nr:hypothetical protein [Arthrobacter sp. FW306-05-C]UKA65942.1 hypothetical protein LFT44_15755 [Arthrobacter sp. FW306-05-C]
MNLASPFQNSLFAFVRVGEAGQTGRCALPVSNRQPHPEPTLGAQLSEVLNANTDEKEGSDFSRRRVVAGVAWSLPVIATAIAAPAAAASPGTTTPASASLGPLSSFTLAGATSASGPTSFTIQTGSSFLGPTVSYSVTFTARDKNQKALISVGGVSQGSGTNSVSQNKQSSSFSGSVPASAGAHALTFALSTFSYTDKATKGTYIYDVALQVTLNSGTSLTAVPSTLTVTYP